MTKEQLAKANTLNDAINSWKAKQKAIKQKAERVSIRYDYQIFRDVVELTSEEIQIIREGLGNYYDSKIASLEEELEKL